MTFFATRRGVAAAIVASLAVLVAVGFGGRWERSHNAEVQNARMRGTFELATDDGLLSKRLDGYRLAELFDCLLYHPPARPRDVSALEVCFDTNGRLVETIDRRTVPPHFSSLREEPSLATLSVPVPRLLAAFARVGAFQDPRFAGVSRTQDTLPVGFEDIGVFPRGKWLHP